MPVDERAYALGFMNTIVRENNNVHNREHRSAIRWPVFDFPALSCSR